MTPTRQTLYAVSFGTLERLGAARAPASGAGSLEDTLFGAVRGVIHPLQGRLVGVPEPHLRQEVAALVGALVLGAKVARRDTLHGGDAPR